MKRRAFLKIMGYSGITLTASPLLAKMLPDKYKGATFDESREYGNAVLIPTGAGAEIKKKALEALYVNARGIIPRGKFLEFRINPYADDYGRYQGMAWYYSDHLPKARVVNKPAKLDRNGNYLLLARIKL